MSFNSAKSILQAFKILEREFDITTKTELRCNNNYQLLVAIMLSAQATDKSVNNITERLFASLRSPQDAIDIGVNGINNLIKTINYHNIKAEHIVEMSKQLMSKFDGNVPRTFNDLISLSGVGRKTANLVLSIAFGRPTIAVDTHVFRVSNRLGWVDAKNVLETERQLLQNVPAKKHILINALLIPFGRKYCKAIKPKCSQCKLRQFCKEYNKNLCSR